MNPKTAFTIMRKELLDTLRDKRTLMMMIGVPVLLYPGMLLIGIQAASIHKSKLDREMSQVAIQAEDPALIQRWLAVEKKIEVLPSTDVVKDLFAGVVDAVIVAGPETLANLDKDGTAKITIRYDSTEFSSTAAMRRVRDVLEKESKSILKIRLDRTKLSEAFALPIEPAPVDTAPPQKTTGFILGLMLPMMMVVTIALGAFYPAVDLTAGEKERGTFETLLSTPAAKSEIVFGKFAAVFILAMATGLLNLASMALTSLILITQMGDMFKGLPFSMQLPMTAILSSVAVMIPLALLISAVMMGAAVMARSFKEAQNYLTPVMLLVILPATVGGLPGVELGAITQFVPIANVVLLFKALMTDKAGFDDAFNVFFSTSVFALLALLFAAWLFQREEVVLSEERGIPLSFRRSDFERRRALTPSSALTWFAVQTLLLFYGGMLLQKWHLITGLVLTEWVLILGATLALLWFLKVDFKESLNLRRLSLHHLGAGLLIGVGSLVLVIQMGLFQNRITPLPEGLKEGFAHLFSGGDTWYGLLVLLFAVSISPAICEEVLFRGAILSGLRQRLGPWAAILLTGLLFGLFHISIYRILPTGLLGIMLTYLAVRSNTIFLGMIVHGLVNGTAVLATSGYLPNALAALLDEDKIQGQWLPAWLLAFGVALLVVGVLWIELTRSRGDDYNAASKAEE